ncbi:unnamed protein product [Mucor fragilis]
MAMASKSAIPPLPVKVYSSASLYDRLIQLFLQICSIKPSPEPSCIGIFMEFGKFIWVQKGQDQFYKEGFFGKGDLSRSDPTWLKRTVEQNKNSLEEITVERRRKRRQKNSDHVVAADNVDTLTSIELLDATWSKDVEHFQLDLYEAFFLAYAVNALSIMHPANQMPLSIADCWSTFCKANSAFHSHYAVYHFYRSLGWVPKTGSKFGVDFGELLTSQLHV